MNRFAWGDAVAREDIGGIPFLMYEPRRRRVPELLHDAERWGDRPHLIQGDRTLTFREFLAAVDAVAEHLRGVGIKRGDRMLILAANSPEWVVALWAGLALGAIVAPGNGWWSEEEVEHALALVEPTLVIGDAKRLAKLPAATESVDVEDLRPIVDEGAAAGHTPGPYPGDGDENEPALIVFTAGTTGPPKGATLAHRSWIATMHQTLAVSRRLPHALPDDDAGFVSLLTGPLFHIGGLHALGLALISGGTLVFLEGRFDAGQVLEVIERHRVEVWGAIPTMTIRVLEHPDLPRRDVSSLRSVPLGGAPVSDELLERIQAAFPSTEQRVTNVYGMTETSGTVARASGRMIREFPGTTGQPLPAVDMKIADPDEDGVGEVLVRTPGQMLGYWKDPDNPIVDNDGFVHSGDLGKLVEGRLYITGRSKDIVIRAGENIAAPHVEGVLLAHPDVADVAVVGLPHPDLGEEVAAAVRLRDGASTGAEDLEAYARARLAGFEVPSAWWISTEELPMTGTGKADKKRLREIFPVAG
jgi:long-chain acyl-CoA synthetase